MTYEAQRFKHVLHLVEFFGSESIVNPIDIKVIGLFLLLLQFLKLLKSLFAARLSGAETYDLGLLLMLLKGRGNCLVMILGFILPQVWRIYSSSG